VGLGGLHRAVRIQPNYPQGDPRNVQVLGGSPGLYRVVFTFARPGYIPAAELDISIRDDSEGDSHLHWATSDIETIPRAIDQRERFWELD
jgi:hypothetical protein